MNTDYYVLLTGARGNSGDDIERQLKIEIQQGWKRSLITADSIEHHLENMKITLLQLPLILNFHK